MPLPPQALQLEPSAGLEDDSKQPSSESPSSAASGTERKTVEALVLLRLSGG
jgi:hypothetical protein